MQDQPQQDFSNPHSDNESGVTPRPSSSQPPVHQTPYLPNLLTPHARPTQPGHTALSTPTYDNPFASRAALDSMNIPDRDQQYQPNPDPRSAQDTMDPGPYAELDRRGRDPANWSNDSIPARTQRQQEAAINIGRANRRRFAAASARGSDDEGGKVKVHLAVSDDLP